MIPEDADDMARRQMIYRGRKVSVLGPERDGDVWVEFADTGTQTWAPIKRLREMNA